MAITFFKNLSEKQENLLSVRPYSASSTHNQEGVARPLGVKIFHQILLVVDGEGVVHSGDRSYKLKRGSAFFTSKDCPNEYANHGELVTAFLTVNGDAIEDLISYADCDGFLFLESVNVEKYLNYINQILNEYYSQRREPIISALSYSMFCDFFAESGSFSADKNDKAIQYIEKHFAEKLTLDAIAAYANVSVSNLCHGFKEKYGTSVFTYIMDFRLSNARNLILSEPGLQIKSVASASGFDDLSYFCRAYKKKFGNTPRADKSLL